MSSLYSFFSIRVQKRLELGLSLDDVVLISAGRLDANKNNETTIRALARAVNTVNNTTCNIKLLLCGDGEQRQYLESLVKELNIQDQVLFLGNRSDIMELYQAADIFVIASFREGLSRSIMEAMASGLPCIVSKIRGNVDLIDENGGYCIAPTDVDGMAEATSRLAQDEALRERMKAANLEKIKGFDTKVVNENMKKIYQEVLTKR